MANNTVKLHENNPDNKNLLMYSYIQDFCFNKLSVGQAGCGFNLE